MGYTKDTVKGSSWIGGIRLFTRSLTFIRTAILARILTPAQFGVFGIAALILALIEILTETGINVFLVQLTGKIDKYVNTAWVVSILRGLIISLVIIISAPLVSLFFNSPDSFSILLLISTVPLIRGFINPSEISFQKDLQFNKEFYFRSSIFLIDSSVSVMIALLTRDISSIVWGLIIGALVEVILSFLLIKPRPKFVWEEEIAKNVLSRGKWVTLAGVFNYLFTNLDSMVVGKILGTSALGFYQMAYKTSILPITEVSDVISKVTFPIYVKISNDTKRLRVAFIKTTVVESLLVTFIGLAFFLFTREIVYLVLGPKWLEIVPVFKILAVFGVIRGISSYASSLFFAKKKQEYVTIFMFFSMLGLAVSIIPLVSRFGIVGAGYSALLGSLLALPVLIYFTIKIFQD